MDWEYETTSFGIVFGEAGQAVRHFTPDFYLPEQQQYIEITTMNQKLVTKKNRKVRLLALHHPDVKCKILYQRDYLHLVIKYGLEDPDQNDELVPPTRMPGAPQVVRLGEDGRLELPA